MRQIRHSAGVAQPIGRVFDYLTDVENAPEIFRGVKEMQKLTVGPLQRGSKLLAIRGPFDEEFHVADHTPPTSYVLEGGISRLTTRIRYELEATDSGTKVGLVFAWQLHGVWRLAAPLFRWQVSREYRETFAHVIGRLNTLDEPAGLVAASCEIPVSR